MNKEKVRKLLNDLDVKDEGVFDGKHYIITLNDSDDYARYYTILDHADEFELVDTSSMLSEYLSSLSYSSDDFTVTLNADFNSQVYKLVIEEK